MNKENVIFYTIYVMCTMAYFGVMSSLEHSSMRLNLLYFNVYAYSIFICWDGGPEINMHKYWYRYVNVPR